MPFYNFEGVLNPYIEVLFLDKYKVLCRDPHYKSPTRSPIGDYVIQPFMPSYGYGDRGLKYLNFVKLTDDKNFICVGYDFDYSRYGYFFLNLKGFGYFCSNTTSVGIVKDEYFGITTDEIFNTVNNSYSSIFKTDSHVLVCNGNERTLNLVDFLYVGKPCCQNLDYSPIIKLLGGQ